MRSRRSVRPRARAEAVGERRREPTGEHDRVGIAVRDVPAVGITPKLIQPPRASVLRLRRPPQSRADPRDRVRSNPRANGEAAGSAPTRKTPSCTYARPPQVPRHAIDRGLGHAPSGRATVRTLA